MHLRSYPYRCDLGPEVAGSVLGGGLDTGFPGGGSSLASLFPGPTLSQALLLCHRILATLSPFTDEEAETQPGGDRADPQTQGYLTPKPAFLLFYKMLLLLGQAQPAPLARELVGTWTGQPLAPSVQPVSGAGKGGAATVQRGGAEDKCRAVLSSTDRMPRPRSPC